MPNEPQDEISPIPQANPISEPVNMPPSEPEAPRSDSTPEVVNNTVPIEAENKAKIENTEETSIDTPEAQTSTPELPHESETPKTEPQTAQTPVSEPLNSTSEPLGERVEVEVPEVKTEPIKEEVKQTETKPIPESKPVILKPNQKDLWQRFLNKVQIAKRKKLEKIMTLFAKRTKITNDEVEKYLHVSDATAERYLNILEKENKIKQSGKTGKAVSYSKL